MPDISGVATNPEWMDGFKETWSSRHDRTDAHMNSQKLRQYALSLHRFKPDVVPVLRWKNRHKLPLDYYL